MRAVTRDSRKAAAQELASLGAEVVEADFDNETSLAAALDGTHAIFCIINFWDKNFYDIELEQGKLVNKLASRLSRLEDYLFSGLYDGRKLAGGKFQISFLIMRKLPSGTIFRHILIWLQRQWRSRYLSTIRTG